jgi:hypothetical protein
VGDIKDAGGRSDGLVFVNDTGVLHGHFPAAEFNQARAEFLMRGKKWCAFQHDFSPRSVVGISAVFGHARSGKRGEHSRIFISVKAGLDCEPLALCRHRQPHVAEYLAATR